MKLNNNGWGLRVAILFIMLFIFCLLFSVTMIKKWGLESNDMIIDNKSNSTEKKTDEVSDEYYVDLETSVYEAIQQYINDNPKVIENKTNEVVNIKKLISFGYLQSLTDENNKQCSGYVEITNDTAVTYNAYIKCNKYSTSGYDAGKDL